MDEKTWRQELLFQRQFGAQVPCNITKKGIGEALVLTRMDCTIEMGWLLLCFYNEPDADGNSPAPQPESIAGPGLDHHHSSSPFHKDSGADGAASSQSSPLRILDRTKNVLLPLPLLLPFASNFSADYNPISF
jgi:hypothetical protein